MVALLTVLSEDNSFWDAKEFDEKFPSAFSKVNSLLKGKFLSLCPNTNKEIFGKFDNVNFLNHSEDIYQVLEHEEDLVIAGKWDFVNCFAREADILYVLRIHNDEEFSRCNIFPQPGGVWKERSRVVVREKDSACSSIITYIKNGPQSDISVIISTYNQPAWLEKTLWGYQAQKHKNFELIIADDGSGEDTFEMLNRVVPQLNYPVKHVWHKDEGFRKCDILNKAILACATDYVLFSDGDCIPRNDFVDVHFKNRKKGHYLSNGYYKLDKHLSELITKEDILEGRCFELNWLKENGLGKSFKNNKFTAKGWKRWFLNRFTPTKATWNGHGSSGWLTDIISTNGFDERMKYGGQDREFGERLVNKGIKGKQIRYSTVCIHLDHSRGYASPEGIAANKALRKITRNHKIKRTPFGIIKDNCR